MIKMGIIREGWEKGANNEWAREESATTRQWRHLLTLFFALFTGFFQPQILR